MKIKAAVQLIKWALIIKEALGDEKFKEFLETIKDIFRDIRGAAAMFDELADLTPWEKDDEWATWVQTKLGIDADGNPLNVEGSNPQ